MAHRAEQLVALVDVVLGQRLEPAQAERLDVVGGEHAAVDHRLAETVVVDAAVLGEVARERAGKTVAGAGRVVDVLQRVGGRAEEKVLGKQQAPVFAFLDDDPNLPPFPELPRDQLVACLDAAHATDLTTRRSVTGCIVFFCGAAVACKSRLQPIVATGSTEAEFHAAVTAAKVVKYLRHIYLVLLPFHCLF